MRRIYVLFPDVGSCRAVIEELEQSGIDEHHIHVIGSANHDLEDLPRANALQESEIAHGIEWGFGLGALAGIIGAWMVVSFPPPGVVLGSGWAPFLSLGAAGAVGGAVISAVLGKGIPSHKLRPFENAIDQGQLLALVDVPRQQVDATKEMITRHHPEASIGVTRPPSRT